MQLLSVSVRTLRRFHLTMMCVWVLLLIPSLLWWKTSVLWVILLSVYANFMGHFSSWQGTRAEEAGES